MRLLSAMRALIVEDNWVWADAVAHRLTSMPRITQTVICPDTDSALRAAREAPTHLALVDLVLGEDSGLRVARVFAQRHPEIKVVIVTGEPSGWALAEAEAAQVAGFVAKDDLVSGERLTAVLESVFSGIRVYSPAALEAAGVAQDRGRADADRSGLTPQELELVRHLARGLGTAEIARQMHCANQTVLNRTHQIGAKLGVSGRLAIVTTALARGLIAPPGRD